MTGRETTHECVAGMGGWCITCRQPVAGREATPTWFTCPWCNEWAKSLDAEKREQGCFDPNREGQPHVWTVAQHGPGQPGEKGSEEGGLTGLRMLPSLPSPVSPPARETTSTTEETS